MPKTSNIFHELNLDLSVVSSWRKSTNGIIANNYGYLFIAGASTYHLVDTGAPAGWDSDDNVIEYNNYILSDENGDPVSAS
ncbi:MAG: hypothetical protein ACXABY_07070 [Candidatus Thorarchaeota archaeon]|jgi:hypothetical protein